MPIELSPNELELLAKIAAIDGISEREALHNAIFFSAAKVDYTKNIAGKKDDGEGKAA